MGLFSSIGNSLKGVAKSFGTTAGFSAGAPGGGGGGASAAGLSTGNPWLAAGGLALDYLGQRDANAANMDIMNKQMQFQKRMSNTSYQRATKDMIAAGLNPMLAYSQGGASTPSGATTKIESNTAKAVQSMISGSQVASAIDLQRSQSAQSATQSTLNSAQTAKVNAETLNEITRNPNLKAELEKIMAEIGNIRAQTGAHNASTKNILQNVDTAKPAATAAGGFMDLFNALQGLATVPGKFISSANHMYRSYHANRDAAVDRYKAGAH